MACTVLYGKNVSCALFVPCADLEISVDRYILKTRHV